MTTRQRTPFAARLLQRLVPTQDHSALLGDLQEERRRGRSTVWYILQIVAAIVVGSWRDIRTHRLLTLRAIGVGVAALVVYFFALTLASTLIDTGLRRLYDGILVGDHWIYWRPTFTQLVTFTFLEIVFLLHSGFFVSGWVIGRLYRAHGIAFVAAFAAFWGWLLFILYFVLFVVAYISPSSRVIADPSIHVNYVNPFWTILTVVTGGYFATRRVKTA